MNQINLEINTYKYVVYTWGKPENTPLYFLHGWMDSGANFHFVAEMLKDDFYIVAPDLRGHGKTEKIKDPLGNRFYDYVADFYELHNSLHPNQVISLIGHSMGGNIGLLYAGTFPNRVKNFINIEGLGIPNNEFDEGPEKMRKWIEGPRYPSPIEFPGLDVLRKSLRKKSPNMEDNVLDWVVQNLAQVNGDSVQLLADPKLRLVHPHLYQWEIIRPFVKRIKAKFCFVWGDETFKRIEGTTLPASFKEQWDLRFKELPSDTIFESISECGHMVHYEKPKELAKVISKNV